MFYHIHGSLELLEQSTAVVEAAGVGYCLNISGNTRAKIASLSDDKKKDVKLLTHLSVREDGVELFGFYTNEELNVFRLLISVSGIGPKAAMSILSFMTPEKLALAVSTDDRKAISAAPGIGPKTAARIVLELKDKLRGTVSDSSDDSSAAPVPTVSAGGNFSEAIDALTVLGFNRSAALEALRGIPAETELEDMIRAALKKLMK